MTQIVYVNGEYLPANEAKISIFDRGFLFADSIYEVIPVYKGKLFSVQQHLERLYSNLVNIRMIKPDIDWLHLFNTLIAKNGAGDMQIYLQITRGNQNARKHDIPKQYDATIIAFTLHNSYPHLEDASRGLHAYIVEDTRWLHCDIKSTALLANVLLNDDAMAQGADTAILSRQGFVTEGSASNVFIVDKNHDIITPPLSHLCLPGITRQLALKLLQQLNCPVYEKAIPIEALFEAEEIWITSTTKEIYPVTKINNQIVGNGVGGKIWQQVFNRYQQLVRDTHG